MVMTLLSFRIGKNALSSIDKLAMRTHSSRATIVRIAIERLLEDVEKDPTVFSRIHAGERGGSLNHFLNTEGGDE